jgi:hypothetical protein
VLNEPWRRCASGGPSWPRPDELRDILREGTERARLVTDATLAWYNINAD